MLHINSYTRQALRFSSEALIGDLGLKDIAKTLRKRRQSWYDRVIRMADGRCPKSLLMGRFEKTLPAHGPPERFRFVEATAKRILYGNKAWDHDRPFVARGASFSGAVRSNASSEVTRRVAGAYCSLWKPYDAASGRCYSATSARLVDKGSSEDSISRNNGRWSPFDARCSTSEEVHRQIYMDCARWS